MFQRLLTERRWGMVLGVAAVGFTGFFLFAFGVFWSTPGPILAAAPDFTGTLRKPTDGQQNVAIATSVEIHSSVALAPTSVNAWTSVTSGTVQHLRAVAIRPSGSSDAVAVGRGGSIRYTTNAGTSWSSINTGGFFSELNAVDCSPSMDAAYTCVAVGDAGDDGGGNTVGGIVFSGVGAAGVGGLWGTPNQYAENANVTLLGVAVPDNITAYAVGTGGVIYKTTNGGSQWTALASGTATTLRDIACYSTSSCVAVGDSGLVLWTNDGGTSWATASAGSWAMYGVSATDNSSTYFAVGADADIWKTIDGGSSWSEVSPGSLVTTFRSIYCLNANTCIAVGTSGVVVRTTNGGSTWVQDANASDADLYGISGSATLGADKLAVGNSGAILTPQLANVKLQTNTGNTQGGAPTGSNLCTSASVGVGNAGPNTRISCTHGDLTRDTWYTFTLVGASDGIRSATNETMATDVTVTFQTQSSITIARQPTDLDLAEVLMGADVSSTETPSIGFSITGTDNQRLKSVSVRIDTVAGSDIASSDIARIDLIRDSATPGSDAMDGTFDDFTASTTDVAGSDDLLGRTTSVTIGTPVTISVAANAHTANASRFPSAMTDRGTYEFYVAVRSNAVTGTTKMFTVTLVSTTCETSDGSSETSCTVTSATTATTGAAGWVPTATSATIGVATQPTDLGLAGVKPWSNYAPFVGYKLTSTSIDALERVTIRVDAPEGSTFSDGDLTSSFIRIVSDTADPSTDWVSSTVDTSFVPADYGDNDDEVAFSSQYPLTLGKNISLVVTSVARASNKHYLVYPMAGRGDYEHFIVLKTPADATAATETLRLTLVSAKCRSDSGTLVNCGLNSVTTGTIAPDTTAPSIASSSPSSGATEVVTVAGTATVTMSERLPNLNANEYLGAAGLLRLRACTGSDQSSTDAACGSVGDNLCTAVVLAADASSNPARRFTCTYGSALTEGRWHRIRLESTTADAAGNTLGSAVDRYFKTAGGGAPSMEVTPPGPVTNLRAVALPGSVTLTWIDPTNSGTNPLASILVFRNQPPSQQPAPPALALVAAGAGRYVDTNVQEGMTYRYLVRASNGELGLGVSSDTILIPAFPPPVVPTRETPEVVPSPPPPEDPIPPTLEDQLRTLLRAIFGADAFNALPGANQQWLLRFLVDG
ncbi:Ig-like domain-containing protein, partial [Candidatus Uhrbacteria bacterium]|nr:Ig-like domain-containing protein [Candidatus Uhrbacteria bacterium]